MDAGEEEPVSSGMSAGSWRGRWGAVLGRYGWRIYAVPLLGLLTAFVLFQSVVPSLSAPPDQGPESAAQDGGPAAEERDEPVVTEEPVKQQSDPELFSAELPPGPPIPKTGARTFDVLPGNTPEIGDGELYRYTVETEVGVDLPEGNDAFGKLVQSTLSDPRSWTNPKAGGISLQRVDAQGANPDFRVILASQDTAREVCGYDEGVPFDSSCRKGEMVYLNAARWVRGAVSFEGDMGNYQRYMINHEVGHVFDNGHVPCPESGALAPVMMQQSFSVDNNELNELNDVADQGTPIPADGKTCEYNAWPFPQAAAK